MRARNMIWFKPRKYSNSPCSVDGHRFDSRREADYYGQLKIEKRAKLIKDFEMQVTFELYAWSPVDSDYSGEKIQVCSHRVDFLVTLPDGNYEVREVKGYATPEWNLKRKLFEANYPKIQYKVVR